MRYKTACWVFVPVIAGGAPSHSAIKSVTIGATKDIGPFRGNPYVEIEARMEGTAPGGDYSVPITLLLPKQAGDGNGFAVVDILNTVAVGKDLVLGPQPLPLARHHIGDDFLLGTGHVYVGVLWDRRAVESSGAGQDRGAG